MRKHKNFWDKNADRYDRFMRKDRAAYEKMYALIQPVVKAKTVLELATGTGLIAKHIVNAAAHIEATDASPEMIAEAKRDNQSAKLHFSVQDMFCLPYADKSFDAVIVSNAQQVDERGIPALPTAKRLGGAEKRCSKGVLPADLCGMCEIGGVIRCHFLRTPESLWGLAGKSWSP